MLHPLVQFIKRRLAPYPRLATFARRNYRRARNRWPVIATGSQRWDTLAAEVEGGVVRGWLDSQWIEDEYIRPQISGDRNVYYLQHFFDNHVPRRPAERGLSLGCGGGNLERALIAMETAKVIDAYDASPGSIEVAVKLAAEAGMAERIRYQVADVNTLELPAATYDWVICKMSLHHFEALEHVYAQIKACLKPGCVFMFNEFIGPTRHQWTDLQLELMNRMLDVLPPSVRSKVTIDRFERLSEEEMIHIDPTESVRSAEIMPVLHDYFEVLEYKPYGGTLLQIALQNILPHLDLENEHHVALLRGFCLYEGTLIEHGVLPSDFAYVVARPRG